MCGDKLRGGGGEVLRVEGDSDDRGTEKEQTGRVGYCGVAGQFLKRRVHVDQVEK